jgi:hypothetical protein
MIDRVGRDDIRPAALRPAGPQPEVGTTAPSLDVAANRPPYLALLLDVLRARSSSEPDGLGAVFGASLRLAALDALGRLAVAPPPAASAPPVPAAAGTTADAAPTVPSAAPTVPSAAPAAPATTGPTVSPPPPRHASSAPANEEAVIKETAERAGIDPDFLRALRRVENGGPGREFGVLSVPAPTYRDQAVVAAETVRRNVGRYEQTGRHAIDPATGRYTPEFIRFFSGRYAPVGAANDPTGLNRYHQRNLLRAYGVQGADSTTT